MRAKEIREMNRGELERFLEEQRAKAVQLRFDIISKQLKNNREYRKVKKDIARILTLLKEVK